MAYFVQIVLPSAIDAEFVFVFPFGQFQDRHKVVVTRERNVVFEWGSLWGSLPFDHWNGVFPIGERANEKGFFIFRRRWILEDNGNGFLFRFRFGKHRLLVLLLLRETLIAYLYRLTGILSWRDLRERQIRNLLEVDHSPLLVHRRVIDGCCLMRHCDRVWHNGRLHRRVHTECRYHCECDLLVVDCPWTARRIERSDQMIESLTRRGLWNRWVNWSN